LQEDGNACYVSREEYFKLLLGFKRLVRADDAAHQVRGLLDLETGARYLIHEDELINPRTVSVVV
jgi:hypothetical protein